jgi:hypothetical protein
MADGIEESMLTYHRSDTNAAYDILVRREDDYAWQGGRRTARATDLVNGQAW